LLIELEDVLGRRKFQRRLESAGVDPQDLVFGYAALARLVIPTEKPAVVLEDPDDDEVLACALSARAEVIVSGDRHLRVLEASAGFGL
jgi:predicted nucleic acid-binding protein